MIDSYKKPGNEAFPMHIFEAASAPIKPTQETSVESQSDAQSLRGQIMNGRSHGEQMAATAEMHTVRGLAEMGKYMEWLRQQHQEAGIDLQNDTRDNYDLAA